MKNNKIQISIFEYGHYQKSVSCIFHCSLFIFHLLFLLLPKHLAPAYKYRCYEQIGGKG